MLHMGGSIDGRKYALMRIPQHKAVDELFPIPHSGRLHRRVHRAQIPRNQRYVLAGADRLGLHQLHGGCLYHGVRRGDSCGNRLEFYHSQCLAHEAYLPFRNYDKSIRDLLHHTVQRGMDPYA